jgi:hypothetical protein
MLTFYCGYISPDIFQIAFDEGHLSSTLLLCPSNDRYESGTAYVVNYIFGNMHEYDPMFYDRCLHKKNPVTKEEYESNILGTIDVMLNNFVTGNNLSSYFTVYASRQTFQDWGGVEYPDNLPPVITTNVIGSVMSSTLDYSSDLLKKVVSKLVKNGVHIPEMIPLWIVDKTRPLPLDRWSSTDVTDVTNYTRVLSLVNTADIPDLFDKTANIPDLFDKTANIPDLFDKTANIPDLFDKTESGECTE